MQQVKALVEACARALRQYSFTNAYHGTFELVRADTAALRDKAYRLRYKVYCEEHGFESPPAPDSLVEIDAYDERASHYLLLHRLSGETIGTLRVILPGDQSEGNFPVHGHCAHPLLQMEPRAFCEISRFCMAKRFRRRPEDGNFLASYYEQDEAEGADTARRLIPYPQAALLAGAFEAALEAGVSECVWMVEPRHLRSLNKIGFPYRILGPKVDCHGGLEPLIFNIRGTLESMRTRAPHCWDIVSDSGRLQHMAETLGRSGWIYRLLDDQCWDEIYRSFAAAIGD